MKQMTLIILLFSQWALADNLAIPITRSELTLPRVETQESGNHSGAEINFSNWSPKGYSESSFLQNTTAYHAASSELTLNLWSSGWNTENFRLSPKAGFSYGQLQRHGSLEKAGQIIEAKQNMTLYVIRLGAEIKSQKNYFNFFQPYAGAALLPTWAQEASSEFSQGISRSFVSSEITLGTVVNVSDLAKILGIQTIGFSVGIEDRESFNGSPLTGTGVVLGARIEL